MNRKALIAVALLALAVQGCGPAFVAATGTAVMAANDRRTTSTIYQDESVERHIGREVGGRFGSLTHVNVTPYNRVVLLTGEAPDEFPVDVDEERDVLIVHVLDASDPEAVRARHRQTHERARGKLVR